MSSSPLSPMSLKMAFASFADPEIACPVCGFEFPQCPQAPNFAEDHLISTHHALLSELPDDEHEPLELVLSFPKLKNSRRTPIVFRARKSIVFGIFELSKELDARLELFRCYGDPTITISSKKTNVRWTGQALDPKSNSEGISAFTLSYSTYPSEFESVANGKIQLTLIVHIGTYALPPRPEDRPLKRSGAEYFSIIRIDDDHNSLEDNCEDNSTMTAAAANIR